MASNRSYPRLKLVVKQDFVCSHSNNQATIAHPPSLRNLYYFRVNYLLILALVLAVSLLSHPPSFLLLTVVFGAWPLLYILRPQDQHLVILGRTFSDCEALIGLSPVTVVVILMTSVVSLLLSTFALGMALVCAHGLMICFLTNRTRGLPGFLPLFVSMGLRLL